MRTHVHCAGNETSQQLVLVHANELTSHTKTNETNTHRILHRHTHTHIHQYDQFN